MRHKKIVDIISTILLFIGFFFAFLPHAFHERAGFSESSHLKHVIYGIALIVVSLAVLVYNNDAFRFHKKHLN